MSTITLIRHGQATPFDSITDRLSPIGEAQSKKLADYWLRYDVRFDEVYTGPLVRQQRTAEIVAEGYAEAGAPFPAPVVMEEFREYDADGILTKLRPALAARNPEFKKLVDQFEANREAPDRNRYFQKMFESLMTIWLQGHIHLPYVESWLSFSSRVERGLKQLIQGGSRRRIAVFTSGGPIGVAVQIAVDAAEKSVLELNWRVRNCSITELMFNRDKLTLDWFNSIPHLDETYLRTYR
ncbi:MAG: histidine phosphatase family protein [Acidobacteria bacterium]|nr:histidine phosphatase family protein [Acidobacteriota bacterium]